MSCQFVPGPGQGRQAVGLHRAARVPLEGARPIHQQVLCRPMRRRRPRGVRCSWPASSGFTPLPNRRRSRGQCSRLQGQGAVGWGGGRNEHTSDCISNPSISCHPAISPVHRDTQVGAGGSCGPHLSHCRLGALAASRAHARSDTQQSLRSRCSRERAAGRSASISTSAAAAEATGRGGGVQVAGGFKNQRR